MSEESTAAVKQEAQPRGMPGLTWAVILIGVGVVFLLNNLHIPGFTFSWVVMLRYWPVILILAGLDILVGRRSMFGSLAVAGLAVVVIGGLVWLVGSARIPSTNLGPSVTRSISQPLDDAKSLTVNLNLGAGETKIKSLSGSGSAIEGTYTTNSNLKLDVSYERSGDNGVLNLKQTGSTNNIDAFRGYVGVLDVALNDSVPIDLDINSGAGQVTLDLTGIKLRSLNIDGGAGAVTVMLPADGEYSVKASMGVGALEVRLPKTVDASLHYDGGLSNINLPTRFADVGDHRWQTSGFDSASNKVTLDLNTGVGNVEVRDN